MSGCCTRLQCQQRAVLAARVLNAFSVRCSARVAVMEPLTQPGGRTDPRGTAAPAPRGSRSLPSQPRSSRRGERHGPMENLELLPLLINHVISLIVALFSSLFVLLSSLGSWRSSNIEGQCVGQLSSLEPICRSQNQAQMPDQRANHEVTRLPSSSPYKN